MQPRHEKKQTKLAHWLKTEPSPHTHARRSLRQVIDSHFSKPDCGGSAPFPPSSRVVVSCRVVNCIDKKEVVGWDYYCKSTLPPAKTAGANPCGNPNCSTVLVLTSQTATQTDDPTHCCCSKGTRPLTTPTLHQCAHSHTHTPPHTHKKKGHGTASEKAAKQGKIGLRAGSSPQREPCYIWQRIAAMQHGAHGLRPQPASHV